MKTEPMEHQKEGMRRLTLNPEFYALGCEQGTGKTWMLLADLEQQWERKTIDAALIVAPKGVHTNWIRREIPAHMSIPYRAGAYRSGAGKMETARLERLLIPLRPEPNQLTILAINIDAINSKRGLDFARRFLHAYWERAAIILDESHKIKNPEAMRSRRVIMLSSKARVRRIASGTIATGDPASVWNQFEFLSNGLLGNTSYRAFVAKYTELLPRDCELIKHIQEQQRQRSGAQNTKRRGAPQIPRRDRHGNPVYRNLNELHRRMDPYMFRVLKRDCLGLPEKIYQNRYFDLTPHQRRLYNSVRDEKRLELGGDIKAFNALTVITKLRQITSGFVMADGEAIALEEDSARLNLLMDTLDDLSGSLIIWAQYREEIARVCEALREADISHVEYHGGVSDRDRDEAIDLFQRGAARVFVGTPSAGGTGLTLTRAETAIYYSCDFNLVDRLQSEDRCHRKGTRHSVVYIDFIATDTIDERIAAALQLKNATAQQIMGDI